MCAVARQNCVNSNDMEKVFNLAANWICRSGSFPSSHLFFYIKPCGQISKGCLVQSR